MVDVLRGHLLREQELPYVETRAQGNVLQEVGLARRLSKIWGLNSLPPHTQPARVQPHCCSPLLRESPVTTRSPRSELRGQRPGKATPGAGAAARWLCRSRQTTAGRRGGKGKLRARPVRCSSAVGPGGGPHRSFREKGNQLRLGGL